MSTIEQPVTAIPQSKTERKGSILAYWLSSTDHKIIGHCTELCGLYHSRMLFVVKIVTPAQFRMWISGQQAAQQKAPGSAQ